MVTSISTATPSNSPPRFSNLSEPQPHKTPRPPRSCRRISGRFSRSSVSPT
jgi:hypothetical protein